MKIYKIHLALHSGTSITYFNMNTLTNLPITQTKTVKAHKETAETLIPQKEKVKRKVPWKNEIIIEKKKTTKKACTNEK